MTQDAEYEQEDDGLPVRVPPDARWLTEKQKARELQVSVHFLRKDRLKPQPEVPFKRFGKAIRYPRA